MNALLDLSESSVALIREELMADEVVRWAYEAPLRQGCQRAIIFCLFVPLLSVYLAVLAMANFLVFLVLCFVLLTTALILSRISPPPKNIYVITDRRAIILKASYDTTVHSFFPRHLSNLVCLRERYGFGDFIFLTRRTSAEFREEACELGFLDVPDPAEAEKLLAELKKSANGDKTR